MDQDPLMWFFLPRISTLLGSLMLDSQMQWDWLWRLCTPFATCCSAKTGDRLAGGILVWKTIRNIDGWRNSSAYHLLCLFTTSHYYIGKQAFVSFRTHEITRQIIINHLQVKILHCNVAEPEGISLYSKSLPSISMP